ncbi:hydantoinase/oxoprolinase family protein [Zavarzinella formosa]|uniref:hydantoinase/oxoprolinase family protein n=1 Tax=Zavarzinella formosa TaxID=360055 RepID=UPI00030A9424|nr:hydantoinase/oxoprolinase family protein [Zavarzinella formosa]
MDTNAIGLDIGGANLKLATASGIAQSRRFELWKHPARLAAELTDFLKDIPPDLPVGVTMTGELCDCFRTKREGVRHIVQAVEEALAGRDIAYWSTEGTFLSAAETCEQPLKVAAANWHAQATFVGRFAPMGFAIMIDTGSTTTDVIPLFDGKPKPMRETDVGRLRSGELLYFGVRRTPLCAIVQDGCAEFFATIQDVHVLLGNLPEEPDNLATADGRSMTKEFAWERIARMIGGDRDTLTNDEVIEYANKAISAQGKLLMGSVQWIEEDASRPLDRVILSGSGEWMPADVFRTYRPKLSQIRLSEKLGSEISEAACAYSVAVLRSERQR